MGAQPRTIIVTGASGGIGLAIAKRLLSDSSQHRLLLVSRNLTEITKLQDQYGQRVASAKLDMANTDDVHKVIQHCKAQFGDHLDALILNHGTLGSCQRIGEAKQEDWDETLRVNVTSNVAIIQDGLPLLRRTRGRIIFTSSGAALNAYSSWGAYGASKAAINHLAKTLKSEEPEVTTIAIRPGVVDTDMQRDIREKYLQNMDEKDRQKFVSAKTEGKLLPPTKPGNVIARLAVAAPAELCGEFLSWDDPVLKEFQDGP